jgi:hypothetical protein
MSIHDRRLPLCSHLRYATRAWRRSVDTSFVGILSADALRRELYSGIIALSYLCSGSAYSLGPGAQREREEQDTSVHELLRAILEQEGFLGSMYY